MSLTLRKISFCRRPPPRSIVEIESVEVWRTISIPLFDVPECCFVASFSPGWLFIRARFGTLVECDDGDLRGLVDSDVRSLNIEYCELDTSLTDSAGEGERGSDRGLLRFRLADPLGVLGSKSGVARFLGDSVAEDGELVASRASALLAVPFFTRSFLERRRRRGVGPRASFWRRFSWRLAWRRSRCSSSSLTAASNLETLNSSARPWAASRL